MRRCVFSAQHTLSRQSEYEDFQDEMIYIYIYPIATYCNEDSEAPSTLKPRTDRTTRGQHDMDVKAAKDIRALLLLETRCKNIPCQTNYDDECQPISKHCSFFSLAPFEQWVTISIRITYITLYDIHIYIYICVYLYIYTQLYTYNPTSISLDPSVHQHTLSASCCWSERLQARCPRYHSKSCSSPLRSHQSVLWPGAIMGQNWGHPPSVIDHSWKILEMLILMGKIHESRLYAINHINL